MSLEGHPVDKKKKREAFDSINELQLSFCARILMGLACFVLFLVSAG